MRAINDPSTPRPGCRRRTLVLGSLLLLATAGPGRAQVAVESLDGGWQIRRLASSGGEPGPWLGIQVPSSFETALGTDFDGVAEYRRSWQSAGAAAGTPIYLRFGAVATHARVYVNDREVGEHLGGWTPFRCRIDAALRAPGEQVIRVVVDERVGHNTQGFLPIIAPHFGGIWQSVTLEHHDRPAFDRDKVEVRTAFAAGRATLRVDPGPIPVGYRVKGYLVSGSDRAGTRTLHDLRPDLTLPAGVELAPWSPTAPVRHALHLQLVQHDSGHLVDAIERQVEFCTIRAEGGKILLNDLPLRIRGILHWGYEPPLLHPNRSVTYWRNQFKTIKGMGFNLVKACLWLPPPAFFAAAAEVGLLVWQEYPAWHPDFSPRHLDDLLREYEEFFRLDRSRSVIAARSLTCETGQAAAHDEVIKQLYERCKTVTGAALVVDDSSWISWTRYHDFYDDHPYGNCGGWLGRLRGFAAHIEKHGAKPLLLGEAIAADTWLDISRIERGLGSGLGPGPGPGPGGLGVGQDPRTRPWWTPWALDQQAAFEQALRARHGPTAVAALIPDSLRFGMLARKYQVETFQRVLPDAGYVCSVIRDFRKARMGLLDDLGQPKWPAAAFAWHGDHTVVLDDPRAIRSLGFRIQSSMPRLHGDPPTTCTIHEAVWDRGTGRWTPPEPGLTLPSWPAATPADRTKADALRRVTVSTGGANPNRWTFYEFPPAAATPLPDTVRVQATFDLATLAWVQAGGRLLLVPGGKDALRSQALWFLRGAPYGPPALAGLAGVPRDMLIDLLQFDFDGPVFLRSALTEAMDLGLGFWDTHDRQEDVEHYPLIAEAGLGKGRILLCALGLDLRPEAPFGLPDAPTTANPARAWLRSTLIAHLADDRHRPTLLDAALIEGVRDRLKAQRAPLDGVWLLRTDADDVGVKQGWQATAHVDTAWLKAAAGKHWEALGVDYTGVAWYRKHFVAPPFWQPGKPLHAVFEGVDDSYVLYVNGQRVAAFGDPSTGETVWLVRTHADISPFMQPGANLIALRVVDHQGAGGLHRPVFLTTADPTVGPIRNR